MTPATLSHLYSSNGLNCRAISIGNINLKSRLSIARDAGYYTIRARSSCKIRRTTWTTRIYTYVHTDARHDERYIGEEFASRENVSMQSVNESLQVNNKVSETS